MTVTRESVLELLQPMEPDFTAASSAVGPEALPFLREFIAGDDLHLAVQAASFAGFIESDDAVEVVRFAASHPDPRVRSAAAAGARNLSGEDAVALLGEMLVDDHDGVRRLAIRAASASLTADLRERIETIRAGDSSQELRELATRVLSGDD